jgi:hypothetical protein
MTSGGDCSKVGQASRLWTTSSWANCLRGLALAAVGYDTRDYFDHEEAHRMSRASQMSAGETATIKELVHGSFET